MKVYVSRLGLVLSGHPQRSGRRAGLVDQAHRGLSDFGGELTATHYDVDRRADSRKFLLHIAHTDTCLEGGGHRAGGHFADDVAVGISDFVVGARYALVAELEGDELALDPFGLLLLDECLAGEVLFGDELRDPAQASFERRSGVGDVVAIEAEAYFEAECVACAETDGADTFGLTSFEDSVPDLLTILRVEVDLEATSTGVARVGKDDFGAASEGAYLEGVVRDGREVDIGQTLEYLLGERALDGELPDIVTAILKDGTSCVVRLAPRPVLLDVGCIDHEQVLLFFVVVDEEVVDDTALFVGEAGVLYVTDLELGGIVAGDVLDELEGVRPLDPELTHMRDVEDADALDDGHMFFDNPGGIFDGHIIACELVHLSP